MQAVLLGSTRDFSTKFIIEGFVRERSRVQCMHFYNSKLFQEIDVTVVRKCVFSQNHTQSSELYKVKEVQLKFNSRR